jgi:multiple sugar transport system ATP-binding protein
MAGVTLEKLTKAYGGGTLRAVNELTLDVADGEFLVLVGPSGCGKSTALRMIAGLEEITDGGVWIGDEFVNDVHPKDRDIAMVFQNYALYPHMSVFDNIAFPLQIARMPKAEIQKRVLEAARILELEAYLKRRPGQLSGGQRQRVAMGRAIVRQPAVYLMDEPLSNLDAKLRVQMRAEIAQLQHRLGTTTIYVTHDQIEAMTMGHRVALLKDGVLQQVDTPADIYGKPRNMFVAAFIGAPTMNLYYGTLGPVTADGASVDIGGSKVAVPTSVLAERPGLARYAGRRVVVGIRPKISSIPPIAPIWRTQAVSAPAPISSRHWVPTSSSTSASMPSRRSSRALTRCRS